MPKACNKDQQRSNVVGRLADGVICLTSLAGMATLRGREIWQKTGIVGLAFAVSLAISATDAFAEEPKQENKLIGTWKLVSPKLPQGYTQLKHVTPAQFMWALYEKDGKRS
jgi:hypothetical protein